MFREMRKPFRALSAPIALGLTLALWGCSGAPRRAEGERAGRAYAGKTLAVILPDSSITTVRNPEELAAVFAQDSLPAPSALLAREFGDAFYEGFAGDIDFVAPVRVPDTVPPAPPDQRLIDSVPGTFTLPGHAYTVPAQAWLASRGVQADLALVIGPLASATGTDEIISPKFGGRIQVTYLVVEGWFVIWDYAEGRALAQGRFRPTVEYKRRLTAREWAQAFGKAVEVVGEASPFKGPKWYRR